MPTPPSNHVLALSAEVDPLAVLTEVEPRADAIAAYKAFDRRKSGWVKVALKPGS